LNFKALAFRVYFAARNSEISTLIRRMPRVARRVKSVVDIALPQGPVWVQVRSGISKGLWMRLRLPDEARLWRGEHERATQRAILAAISSGDVVYDVGAHAGSIALGAARLVGPTGRVVGFEADPGNIENLRENSSRNSLTASLQVVEYAVWCKTHNTIPFRRGGARRSHGAVESAGQHPLLADGERISVPAISLDDFIANGGPAPRLIKIDVEGSEYEVLRGGANLFAAQRPLIIVEVHHREAADRIREWLRETQYAGHWDIPRENFPCCVFAWPEEFDGSAWMRKTFDIAPAA
jgi:FkbM family methyltransferase